MAGHRVLGIGRADKNRWLPGDRTFKHGSIVGYIIGDVDVQVIYEFQLVLGHPFRRNCEATTRS